jgi:hypothetical protein
VTDPAPTPAGPSETRPAAGRAAVALAAILAVIVVGLASLLGASPASASSLVGAQTAVGVFVQPGGLVIGVHEPILAGESRQRAPNYDQIVVGSCVGAEEGAALSGSMRVSSALGDKAVQGAQAFSQRFPESGYFDVIGHGTPTDVAGLSPSELAGQISGRSDWAGQNVRLIACEAGCPTGGYAQALANDLGVSVQSPSTIVEFSSRGNIAFRDGGQWMTYQPGG